MEAHSFKYFTQHKSLVANIFLGEVPKMIKLSMGSSSSLGCGQYSNVEILDIDLEIWKSKLVLETQISQPHGVKVSVIHNKIHIPTAIAVYFIFPSTCFLLAE